MYCRTKYNQCMFFFLNLSVHVSLLYRHLYIICMRMRILRMCKCTMFNTNYDLICRNMKTFTRSMRDCLKWVDWLTGLKWQTHSVLPPPFKNTSKQFKETASNTSQHLSNHSKNNNFIITGNIQFEHFFFALEKGQINKSIDIYF